MSGFYKPKVTPTFNIHKVAVYRPEGDFNSYVSHDFTDKTTWWTDSTRVTGESLSGSGVGPYSSSNPNWIDLENGKVTKEDNHVSSYSPNIYDNGVLQSSGFTIDYENGTVTFSSSPTGSVTADYSYESGSGYDLSPASGNILTLEHAEIQFSKNVVFKEIHFEVFSGETLIDQVKYKNVKDLINVSNLGYTIPSFGSLSNDIIVLPFNYSRAIQLKDSLGMKIRVSTKDDAVMSGEFGTVTFYAGEETE